jgi:hypothetical protein
VTESNVEFVETNVLRLKAVLCLGIANIFLIIENWLIFFFSLILSICFEILNRKLYEVLLHNHAVAQHKKNIQERKIHQETLNSIQSQ